jgi:hypothetical protein
VKALVILLALGPAVAAGAPPAARGWSIHAGGGLALGGPSFDGDSRFTLYAEEATLAARHQPSAGPLFEAGVWRRLSSRLGIALTGAWDRRDAGGAFTAALPHPLYLGRPRTVEGALPEGSRRETGVHLGLVWSRPVGGVTVRVGAGPSFFRAEADLAEEVATAESYPYDTVQVTAVHTSAVRGDAFGGHAAASLERALGARLAVTAGARWARARVDLDAEGTSRRRARVTAGGFSAGLGIRLYF